MKIVTRGGGNGLKASAYYKFYVSVKIFECFSKMA